MIESPKDNPSARWATLSWEIEAMHEALNGFTLMGALDRESNHIASMQDEIDQKTREALVTYWVGMQRGDLPSGTT